MTNRRSKLRDLFTSLEHAEILNRESDDIRAGALYTSLLKVKGKSGEVSRQLVRHWRKRHKRHLLQRVPEVTKRGPKVLLLDIETAPITAYVWNLWPKFVGLNQVKAEWNILSFCAKWLGDDQIIYQDARENPSDDSALVAELYRLIDEADIVIAQNGKRFDVPKIQARFLLQGYLPPSPFKIVDTMLMAKQQFGFTSNSLAWMTDKINTGEKKNKHGKFPGFDLWAECLKGNPEAWDEMKDYNIPDVTSMEELYLRLRPWYVGHPNVAIYYEDAVTRCPKCGSGDIKQEGVTYTQSGEYARMHCGGCGGWSRGRYTQNTKEVRRAQLSN